MKKANVKIRAVMNKPVPGWHSSLVTWAIKKFMSSKVGGRYGKRPAIPRRKNHRFFYDFIPFLDLNEIKIFFEPLEQGKKRSE